MRHIEVGRSALLLAPRATGVGACLGVRYFRHLSAPYLPFVRSKFDESERQLT